MVWLTLLTTIYTVYLYTSVHSDGHDVMQKKVSPASMSASACKVSDELIRLHAVRDAVLRLAAPTTWDTELQDPPGMKCELFAYQRRALAWMAWRESTSNASDIVPGAPPNAMAERFIALAQSEQPEDDPADEGGSEDEGARGDTYGAQGTGDEGKNGAAVSASPTPGIDASLQDARVSPKRDQWRTLKAEALQATKEAAAQAKQERALCDVPSRSALASASGNIQRQVPVSLKAAEELKRAEQAAGRASTSKAEPIDLFSDSSDCEIIEPESGIMHVDHVSTGGTAAATAVKPEPKVFNPPNFQVRALRLLFNLSHFRIQWWANLQAFSYQISAKYDSAMYQHCIMSPANANTHLYSRKALRSPTRGKRPEPR